MISSQMEVNQEPLDRPDQTLGLYSVHHTIYICIISKQSTGKKCKVAALDMGSNGHKQQNKTKIWIYDTNNHNNTEE